ncbi:RDD family protein [Candidatus Poriferisodalis sp.]|uniref:RDD family protein n=1 Tax=Candidatus Poriferisodalis sp. TaxID=3101277 RepID=UPI003B01A137
MTHTETEAALLWRRLVARLCDAVCLAAAITLILFLISAGAVGLGKWSSEGEASSGFFGADLVVGFYLLIALVFIGLPAALVTWYVYECVVARRSGQTPGKRLLGLRVVAHDARRTAPPGVDRLSARWMTLQLPTAVALAAGCLEWPTGDRWPALGGLGWLLVVAAPALLSRSRRGLHDWAAHTIVVSAPRPGSRVLGPDSSDQSAGLVKPVRRPTQA